MRDPEFQDNFDPTSPSHVAELGKKPYNLWKALSRMMEVVLYVLVILAVARLFWPEIERQESLQTELVAKTRVLQAKEAKVNRLRLEHKLLKTDKEYLEIISRDRLNMQKEGEYIIRIERE